jgi:hypothetical protein
MTDSTMKFEKAFSCGGVGQLATGSEASNE